jgi:hypothetical protein
MGIFVDTYPEYRIERCIERDVGNMGRDPMTLYGIIWSGRNRCTRCMTHRWEATMTFSFATEDPTLILPGLWQIKYLGLLDD